MKVPLNFFTRICIGLDQKVLIHDKKYNIRFECEEHTQNEQVSCPDAYCRHPTFSIRL